MSRDPLVGIERRVDGCDRSFHGSLPLFVAGA